jgi:hypothetical protein
MRVGLTEIVRMRHEVKLAPVSLVASQEVRLQRLERRSVVRGGNLFIPERPAAELTDFLRTMWPS